MCIANFGTILILDNNEERLKNIVDLLVNDGWDVKGFKNYDLGCRYLDKCGDAISLIIIDADNNKKEYLSTVSTIVNKKIHIPIMVISSNLEEMMVSPMPAFLMPVMATMSPASASCTSIRLRPWLT